MWFSLSVHLNRTGEREAHQLAGTQSCSIRIVRVSNSWILGAIPHGKHDGNCFYKEVGGDPLPNSLQRELSVVVRSHQKEYHNSSPSMVSLKGQHRGELPQQTQTAEVELQANLIGVLEDLP